MDNDLQKTAKFDIIKTKYDSSFIEYTFAVDREHQTSSVLVE